MRTHNKDGVTKEFLKGATRVLRGMDSNFVVHHVVLHKISLPQHCVQQGHVLELTDQQTPLTGIPRHVLPLARRTVHLVLW